MPLLAPPLRARGVFASLGGGGGFRTIFIAVFRIILQISLTPLTVLELERKLRREGLSYCSFY